jgi:polyhydroxyalkanoate synthesis repressor PhaR
MSESTKTIKRYPNRKMYDTEESRYVNLDELAAMIREGIEVRVVDHKSGEDVTGMVLAQILYEEERRKQGTLSTDVMQRIVRFGEENLGPWLQRVFSTTEHPLQSVRGEVEEHVRKLVEKGQITAEEANRFMREWVDLTSRSLEDWQQKVDERVVGVFDRVTGIPSARGKLDELLARIDLMEKRLDVIEDRIRRTLTRLEETPR